jgi:hypothetical protein
MPQRLTWGPASVIAQIASTHSHRLALIGMCWFLSETLAAVFTKEKRICCD